MAISLEQAEYYRDDAAKQLEAASKASSVSSTGRSWSSHSLPELRENLGYWQRVVNSLTATNAGAGNALASIAKWT